MIDPADIAAVAATVLADGGHERTALELSGPEPLTPGEQIAILADALGRPLRDEPQTDEQARPRCGPTRPRPYIDAFFRFYSDGEFDDSRVLDTVARITGRPARRFQQWAHVHARRVSLKRLRRPGAKLGRRSQSPPGGFPPRSAGALVGGGHECDHVSPERDRKCLDRLRSLVRVST